MMGTVTTFTTVITATMNIQSTSLESITMSQEKIKLEFGLKSQPRFTFSLLVFRILYTDIPLKKNSHVLMQNACTAFVTSLGAVTVRLLNILVYASWHA